MNELYEKQVQLLLRVLPHIAAEPSLALRMVKRVDDIDRWIDTKRG